jgi:NADH:ubiquinone reductase (H+-translocating)
MGGQKAAFSFSTLGLLAAIGRRTGVANIFGANFSASSPGFYGGPFI